MYSVKEIYYTLQGEGAQTGRAAVFLRFAGCNLWTGREADRTRAVCQFCDTDFVGIDGPGGGKFADAGALAEAVARAWRQPSSSGAVKLRPGDPGLHARQNWITGSSPAMTRGGRRYIVCTGGEPLLQIDTALIEALHVRGFEVAVETNGTLPAPGGLDWICVSPKAGAELVQRRGSELKLVYPQHGAEPALYENLDFQHFFLQPMDGPAQSANIQAAAAYCLNHPQWRLSLQTHKLIGLP
ncbi:MAG: 7-carboxy-7-deazaguanine synthase QueE [Hyphomicrobiales bacterium]|nr:7-carboxy-7-deazaguanine synthase QueE [Hyphomicrobiales bacterium]